MPNFYVKAKSDFSTESKTDFPVKFTGGHFYEVDHVGDTHMRVAKGGYSVAISLEDADKHFERHEGSFVERVAGRPIFANAAVAVMESLRNNGFPAYRYDIGAMYPAVEQGLRRVFRGQRNAQPDTSVADWKIVLVKNGEPQYFLGEVIANSVFPGHEGKADLANLTLEIAFDGDNSFTCSETITKRSRFVLPEPKAQEGSQTLEDLVAAITPENLHVDREWLDAPPVGREFPNAE